MLRKYNKSTLTFTGTNQYGAPVTEEIEVNIMTWYYSIWWYIVWYTWRKWRTRVYKGIDIK